MKYVNKNAYACRPPNPSLDLFTARNSGAPLALAHMLLLAVLFLGAAAAAAAEPAESAENKACLKCHVKADPKKLVDITRGVHGPQRIGCTHCHAAAPASAESNIKEHAGGMLLFRDNDPLNAEQYNAVCLGCHDDSPRLHWQAGVHAGSDLACSDCHTVHGTDAVLESVTEADVCYRCHAGVRGRMLMPYSHPVREGGMSCRDCHQSHGSAGPAQLSAFSVTEGCTACHAEKRGPFLWEHPPVSEDCTLCHDPHGAIHPGMLTRRQPQLCQSCHMPTGEFAARHARRALEYYPPGTTSTDEVNRLMLGESCLNCHSQVHGSNHPSGAGLMR